MIMYPPWLKLKWILESLLVLLPLIKPLASINFLNGVRIVISKFDFNVWDLVELPKGVHH
ncbi:hypothetical protein HanPSC8_Chr04g0170111 [Helianthus annuus]|nr:hypothetical protein HanPSC8_Chr04g0170111 [Helianthus annuus]